MTRTNVPRITIPPIIFRLVLDVVLENTPKLRRRKVPVVQPVGQLAVPEESVAARHLAGFLAGDDDLVAERVVEDIALRFNVYPFLAIRWRNLVEFRLVERDVCVLLVVENYIVNRSTKIQQSCFLREIA